MAAAQFRSQSHVRRLAGGFAKVEAQAAKGGVAPSFLAFFPRAISRAPEMFPRSHLLY